MFPEVTTEKTTQYIATFWEKKKATSAELKYCFGMSRSLLKENKARMSNIHDIYTGL